MEKFNSLLCSFEPYKRRAAFEIEEILDEQNTYDNMSSCAPLSELDEDLMVSQYKWSSEYEISSFEEVKVERPATKIFNNVVNLKKQVKKVEQITV